MKRFFAMALVIASATTAFARPPMVAPAIGEIVSADEQYAPVPTRVLHSQLGALQPEPDIVVNGAIVVPGHGIPVTVQPGCFVCDSCDGGTLGLYPRVKVIQARNIAPCAVKKIVAVPNPCDHCESVLIEICVPPCACETVECQPRRNRTIFDYGDYAVKVTERKGVLFVNYDKK
ncbi:hypothetical protein SH668x_003750 [Planctomicrobium sp. SH668]|uniref:hypothetical protein n=1 Tax=Planctomicrobium sp. SH668 TaxID=3448126 RepID=UPI003F5BF6B0